MPPLSLEQFRAAMGYVPWHFWGMADQDLIPVSSNCQGLITRYAWQATDALGRADLETAIDLANERFTHQLGYRIAPEYASVTMPWPRYQQRRARMSQWTMPPLQLDEGHILSLGAPITTTVGAAPVVLADADGDGLYDRFTATVATTATDAGALTAVVPQADRLGDRSEQWWEISPVTITITGGFATVSGPAWLLVKPALGEGYGQQPIDPADVNSYLATVEVVETAPDPALHATLTWHNSPYPAWAICCDRVSGTDPAATATATARGRIMDARNGIVQVAEAIYDAGTATWSSALCRDLCQYPPDTVTIHYRAGLTNAPEIAQHRTALARLTAAELERPPCACDDANRWLYHWQYDLSTIQSGDIVTVFATNESYLTNPLGSRRGHVDAWRFLKPRRLYRASAI